MAVDPSSFEHNRGISDKAKASSAFFRLMSTMYKIRIVDWYDYIFGAYGVSEKWRKRNEAK